jgi:hypothetical protein
MILRRLSGTGTPLEIIRFLRQLYPIFESTGFMRDQLRRLVMREVNSLLQPPAEIIQRSTWDRKETVDSQKA